MKGLGRPPSAAGWGCALKVLLAGAPGAGKGTQAAVLAAALSCPHIASGDIIRDHVTPRTDEGMAVEAAVRRGDLTPDALIVDMLLPTLLDAAAHTGYVLDGFPRTADQARAVQDAARASGAAVQVAVHLDVPAAQLRQRLLARGRGDDTAEVITHRLEVYERQTVPMLNYYAEHSQLVTVDGSGSIEQVSAEVVRALHVWLLRRRLAS
jgi:adenylate kinase